MVRKAQNYQLRHSFSLFFPEYHGVFQFSLLDCSLVFFFFFFTNILQCKIFIFYLFWRICLKDYSWNRKKRKHIIFATSLHDCKIVNTDYLLTLFYLGSRFHTESVWELVVEIDQQNFHRNGTRKSAQQAALHFVLRLNDLGFFFFPLFFSSGIIWLSICKCF